MEKFAFKKTEEDNGKEVSVDFKEKIGSGGYGDVFLANVVLEKNDKMKTRSFAIKRFKDVGLENQEIKTSKESAKESWEKFNEIKGLNIPTWTTYRLSENETDILMSLVGNSEHEYVIDVSKGPTKEDIRLKQKGIMEIVNLENIVRNLVSTFQGLKVPVELGWDSFLQIYDDEEKKLTAIVGDFDMVYIGEEDVDVSELATIRSLVQFLRNIRDFISEFVFDEKNKIKYIQFIDNEVDGVCKKFREDNPKHKNAVF